jgi:hypothetical protein
MLSRDIRFEFNYSGSQFWFLQWLSLANPVLLTEIIIYRFADEWGCSTPRHSQIVLPNFEKVAQKVAQSEKSCSKVALMFLYLQYKC